MLFTIRDSQVVIASFFYFQDAIDFMEDKGGLTLCVDNELKFNVFFESRYDRVVTSIMNAVADYMSIDGRISHMRWSW